MTSSIRNEIEKLAVRSKRSSTWLIATFKDGYAENWHMAVRDSFRSQLDIKYTPRIDKKSEGHGKRIDKLLTQGPRIAFDKGHIFYDTPLGYQVWAKAIKHIKHACVVIDAKPNNVKIGAATNASGNTKELIEGFVEVELLVPNNDKTKLIKYDVKKMSQIEFVEFLITGNSK
jgi:hypothetical protein